MITTLSYDPSKNSLIELFLVSFTLGAGSTLLLISSFLYPRYFPLITYLLSLIIYFILEYVNTYLYQSRNQISSRSFLIYGNRGNFEFWCCQLLTILEFIINLKKVKIGLILSWWVILPVKVIGMMMIISGLFIRSLSMKTCGESFSHLINTDSTNTNNQKLITHGIYGYFRHPSYFGFWCLSIGIQLWLINPINLLLSLFILQYFFTIRIQVEEYFLIHNIFGMDYINYKNKVKLWIPFVKDPLIQL